ncbi:putative hydro-lyase [Xanthobacter versatilis]|uniref:putative hydro-lyase n=1 Tax=Xanthobacter autotrophicus (strain ATCC BAA-1158 / Py2) TaxID=78245 RepID=UPI003729184C
MSYDSGLAVRLACRAGELRTQTAGLAHGNVQGNLAILPAALADDFEAFCRLNAQACPLLGRSEPGSPHIPALGADLDIRSDLPHYRVWRDGVVTEEPYDIRHLWRSDLVAFVLGCSHSFEEALLAQDVPLRHIEMDMGPPAYRTNIPTVPAGPFSGPMVVSMRPLKPADVIKAVQITSHFPKVHGAPIHIGFPEDIGITDIGRPDYGQPVEIRPGELPVFWACGVTPQSVIQAIRPDFAITHMAACMLLTDLRNEDLAKD